MNDYIQIANRRGHCLNTQDYIQIARIIGHSNLKFKDMHKDDFYTLCMKDPKNNIGLRKNCKVNDLPVFKLDEVSLEYLCCDLVRFCLSLYKNYSNIDTGEMSLIPKQPIPISEELREYIRDFLPDYYGIRK
jgi:hypothetical protein